MIPNTYQTLYRTALYGRLSVLDNGKKDGDSIESQINILEQYVSERSYLQRVELYVDNGYTGTDFNRPEWDRLIDAVKTGQIDCIVVKDFSRLGRNYIESGHLLEKVFPRLGIRFISINDNYDSALLNSTDELSASLKNIVNDYYAKDISKKACSALKVKRQRGDFVCGYAPHGYLKDPQNKNHLIIDPRTAPVIQQIFLWRSQGDGYSTICRKLNEQDIPSPGRYRYENGILTNRNHKGSSILWSRHMITIILSNITYLGHLAQGKSAARLHEGIPFHKTSQDEWDIVYHTHEPIINNALFQAVQEVNQQKHDAYMKNYGKYEALPKADNPYGKKLICDECGSQMKLYRNIYRGGKKATFTYICPVFSEQRELGCKHKDSMRSKDLDAAVLSALKKQMNMFLNKKDILDQLLQCDLHRREVQSESSKLYELQQQLKQKKSLFTGLYADFKSGILTQDEFAMTREKYRVDIDLLEQRIAELQGGSIENHFHNSGVERWTANINRFSGADHITAEIVDAFINEIRVKADHTIMIQFAFENEYAELIAACEKRSVEVA